MAPGTCYGALDVPAAAQATQQAARRLAEALPTGTLMATRRYKDVSSLRTTCLRCDPIWLTTPTRGCSKWILATGKAARGPTLRVARIDAWTQDFAHALPPGAGENLHSMLARVDRSTAQKPSRPDARPPRGVDHARRRHALRGVAEQSRRQLPLSHQWPLEAPGWGDWVMTTRFDR